MQVPRKKKQDTPHTSPVIQVFLEKDLNLHTSATVNDLDELGLMAKAPSPVLVRGDSIVTQGCSIGEANEVG